jgi:hypothetical protein
VPPLTIYGLVIDSELDFPQLHPASSRTPEISLRIGKVDFEPRNSRQSRVRYKPLSSREVIVHYDGVGTALVQNGASITLQPAHDADPLCLLLFVLQQVLGVLLLQRGFLVLHASAAAIRGRAIAFAGPSGQGKSTLAAALTEYAGAQIITDDVLAIDFSNPDLPLALPGLAQLKLDEPTRAQICPRANAEQRIADGSSKALCEVEAVRADHAVPLAAIYLLETAPTLSFTPVPKARAAIELVRHTYGSRLLDAINLSARHFQQTADLVRGVPVVTLACPRDLSLLPKIAERIKLQLPS